ncbi:DUF5906 domain-containing protein [Staphylococcus hominis]|uniref:DUF5906 domain-containing protein n=2 Tax=Staphylococcus hominis TaxID=1290 RepID=UPI0034D5A4F8
MAKNQTVKTQRNVQLNSSHFTGIDTLNVGIMTSYMHPSNNLQKDVDNKLNTTALIDEDLYKFIRNISTDRDPDRDYARDTHLMYLHKNSDDAKLNDVDPSDLELIETVKRYNAYVKLMTEVAEYYGPRCCFIKATCRPTYEQGNLKSIERRNVTIDQECLINFIEGYFIKKYMSISGIKGQEDEVYIYDRSSKKMLLNSKKVIKRRLQRIVRRIHKGLRCENSKEEKKIVEACLGLIPEANDFDMDHFNKYASDNPNLVWFKNGVYDIVNDKLLEHSPKHYLQNHHDYELPYYKITKDGNTEVKVPHSLEEIKAKCQNTINRLEMLVGNGLEYFITLLGYGFYHSYSKWNVITFLYDPKGGSGKSSFIRMAILPMFSNANVSSVKLKDMSASNNKFALSEVAGKEMNIVTELDDTHFNHDLLNNLKTASGGDTTRTEGKFKSGKNAILHAKLIFSTNKGLPQISTSQQDGAVKRRIVILPVTQQPPTNDVIDYYTEELFAEEKPYFALYCMRIFNKHLQNNSFTNFQPQDPTTPLITNEIATMTRKFIDADNRILQFFIYKAMNHLDGLNEPIQSRESMIEILEHWLKTYHVPTMKDDFEQWYKSVEEYKNSNGLKKYFNQNMEQQYGMYGLDMNKRNRIRTEQGIQISVLQEKAVPHIIKNVAEYLNHKEFQNASNEENDSFASNIVNFGDHNA